MGGANAAMAADGPWDITGTVTPGVIPDAGTGAPLEDPEGNVKELGPLNSNTTKIGVINNDVAPTLGLTNPNAQVDLRQAWLASAKDGTGANAHDWLYFAWERDNNTGSGFIAFEFMQDPAPDACDYAATNDALIAGCNPWANRKAGDFMILWDQQGGSKDLYLRTWTGTAPNLTLSPPGSPLTAAVSQAAYSADGFRGEAALDLTATVFGGSTACRSFANVIPSTVTGNSDTADYKDTILADAQPIGNCTTTTVTTPKDGNGADIPAGGLPIGTGVVAVKDSAVVSLASGTATPAGSVAFSLCKVAIPAPGEPQELCSSGGTSVGSTALTGAAYPVTVASPTAYVTSVGRYCWRAEYNGNVAGGIGGSSDSSVRECFDVKKATPTLSTTAGPDVLLGAAVTDSATLGDLATDPADPIINLTGTAGPAAGGSITFKLYGPSAVGCGDLAYTSTAVTVSGNATYDAPSFAPLATGSYHWVAVYSGSANNSGTTHNAACTESNENVDVTSVPSSLTSAQNWVPNDSVTVSAPAGSGDLAGTVTFRLFANATCTGLPANDVYSVTRDVSGPATGVTVSTANTTAVTASGSYSWLVSYDSTGNNAQRDIPATCHETSELTITNGGTHSSP